MKKAIHIQTYIARPKNVGVTSSDLALHLLFHLIILKL